MHAGVGTTQLVKEDSWHYHIREAALCETCENYKQFITNVSSRINYSVHTWQFHLNV